MLNKIVWFVMQLSYLANKTYLVCHQLNIVYQHHLKNRSFVLLCVHTNLSLFKQILL